MGRTVAVVLLALVSIFSASQAAPEGQLPPKYSRTEVMPERVFWAAPGDKWYEYRGRVLSQMAYQQK